MKISFHFFCLYGTFLITFYQAMSQTDLCGTITSNTTLTLAGSPYTLTCDYTVDAGISLTIESGVEINFQDYHKDLIINGKLIAQGTTLNPIRFYSNANDGGGIIIFNASSTGSIIDHASIERLGIGPRSNSSAIRISSTTINVSNTLFIDNTKADVRTTPDGLDGFQDSNSLDKILITSGSLDRSTTWPNVDSNGFYYVLLGEITVPLQKTLTIEPGVSINFSHIYTDLIINGTLTAQGNTQNPIRFYSDANDGGGIIVFNASSTSSIIDHASIERLGIGPRSNSSAIQISSTVVNVSNTPFIDNTKADVRSTPDGLDGFQDSNSLDKILITSGSLSRSASWPNADENGFYYLLLGEVTVPLQKTLTIQSGVAINSSHIYADLIVDGTLIALGNTQNPIRFYSDADGGGGSIVFNFSSTGSVIEHASIERFGIGARWYSSGIKTASSEVEISHCTLQNNKIGIYISNGEPVLNCNNILDNINYGIYNNGNNSIDACGTWWGDASGPFHPTLNPNGLGNDISDNVLAMGCTSSEICGGTDSGVWPGDKNNDGIVNQKDVSLTGFLYREGPERAAEYQNIQWQGYPCNEWDDNLPFNGANIKHLDCNGDGTISSTDADAVLNNLGLTHNEGGNQIGILDFENTDYQIYLQPVDDLDNDNLLQVNVVFESKTGNNLNLQGSFFTIDYNNVNTNITNAAMNFTNSWLGLPGINMITSYQNFPNTQQIEIGFSKTDGTNSTGKGIIGQLTFVLDNNAARSANDLLDFEVIEIGVHDRQGNIQLIEEQFLQVGLSESNCEPNWIITEDSPFYNVYKSNGTFETDGFVLVGKEQQVKYNANRITLNEGFKARAGADFKIRNSGCN